MDQMFDLDVQVIPTRDVMPVPQVDTESCFFCTLISCYP